MIRPKSNIGHDQTVPTRNGKFGLISKSTEVEWREEAFQNHFEFRQLPWITSQSRDLIYNKEKAT